jgi:hypothetical protein
MPVLLSDEELEALEGLPHLHRCLYIFGIRRYMDYSSGITGIKRKISYKSLSEEVYVSPRQGIKEIETRSVAQLKRAVKILEKSGLIAMQSKVTKDEKQLILKCVLADRDKSVQNKAVPRPYQSPILEAVPDTEDSKNKENHYKNSVMQDGPIVPVESKSSTASRTTQNEKAVPHPLSDKLNNNIRQQFLDLFTAKRFPLAYLADARTNHMLDLWEQASITQDEAKAAIKHGDNEVLSRKGRVTVPWYYQDIPFQLRGDLKHLQEKTNGTTTTQQSKQHTSYAQLRERRAKWRAKCEQEEQDGCQDDRDII